MPIFGLGLHLLIALFFAVHAVRSGREMYWLILLFSFPLLGSAVYFFAIFLPQSRLDRALGHVGKAVMERIDPARSLREAQHAFDLTPTAHNQTRLARAMLDAGMHAQAIAQFDACLRGPFAKDPDILFDAARARLAAGEAPAAVESMLELQKWVPTFRPDQVSCLLARAYAQAGRHDEAGREFAAAVERHACLQTRVEYVLWALSRQDGAVVQAQLKELEHTRRHMTRHTRSLHADLFGRLDTALKQQH